MKENKVPTLSIVLDTPDKKPVKAKKEEPEHMFGQTPVPSEYKYRLHSQDSGHTVDIKNCPFTIGRALTSSLVIMDKIVSRNHAVINMDNGHIVIENKGSLNGVRINNKKVERSALRNGDVIKIASATYVLQVERIADDMEEASLPVTRDDSRHVSDAYNTKSASNDDLLGDEMGKSYAEPGIHHQAEHLASKFNNKTLYALISITLIVVIATVVTVFQSSPDLDGAIENVKVKDASIPDSRLAENNAASESIQGNAETPATISPRDIADNSTSGYQPIRAPRVVDTQAKTDLNDGEVETTYPDERLIENTSADNGVNAYGGQVETEYPTNPEADTTPVTVAKRDIDTTRDTTPVEDVKPEVVAPKVIKPRVVKPAPVKYSRYSSRTSQIKLDNARGLYLGGNYHGSERELKSVYNSSRHSQEYRNTARANRDLYYGLYSLYTQGQSEYARSRKPEAFKTWAIFLKKERAEFQGRTSQYTSNVKKTVALEYEEKGRQAYMRDDWRSAFRYWKSSLKMRPNPSITSVMKKMETEIASLYASGSKLEKTNKPEAIKYWTQVVNKAPDNHEFYIKAKAKLRWLKSASH